MFEKKSVNKFDQNNLLVKNCKDKKKLIEILSPVVGRKNFGRTLGSPVVVDEMAI